MSAKLDLVRSWLIKAQRDLAAAHKLAAGTDPFLDIAIYHCQQAAEKVVKGFLVFHDQPFEKTHDIEVLVRIHWVTGLGPKRGDAAPGPRPRGRSAGWRTVRIDAPGKQRKSVV